MLPIGLKRRRANAVFDSGLRSRVYPAALSCFHREAEMIRSNRFSPHLGRGLVVTISALLFFAGLPEHSLAAGASAADAESAAKAKPASRVVEIPVEGMGCISCAASIKHAVKGLTGVIRVEVSLGKRNARVTYLANLLTPDRIVAAIDKLGYAAGTPRSVAP